MAIHLSILAWEIPWTEEPGGYSPWSCKSRHNLATKPRGSLVTLHSAIRVVSSAYLRLLIFLPAILIPAWDSSSLTFLMMYSA